MADGDPDAGATPQRRRRRRLPIALALLAALLAFASAFSLWVRRQLLETDSFVHVTSAMIEDAQIRSALSDFLADQLYANVDVEGEIAAALPPRLDRLAGPASGALRELVARAAAEALERPRVQATWEAVTRASHAELMRILDGGGRAVSTEGGAVTLDLRPIVAQIADRVGVDPAASARIPPDAGRLTVMRSSQLKLAQNAVKAIRGLSVVLPILTLLCLALALWLAAGARRETLRSFAIGLIVGGVAIMLARSLIGGAVVDALAKSPAAEPAAQRVWDIATAMLRDGGVALIVYGLLTLLGTTLAGPTRGARAVRRALAPLAAPRWAYPLAAGLAAILLWWGPTEGLRRPLPAAVLIAMLIIGIELLRRQIVREAPPGAPQPTIGDLLARVSPARLAGGGDRIAELERLARLRQSGALDDDEFAREKERLLG